MGYSVLLQSQHLIVMATARETSYLGNMRLLLLLLLLATPCVIAQEGKSNLRTWTSSIGAMIETELVSTTGEKSMHKSKTGDGQRGRTISIHSMFRFTFSISAAWSRLIVLKRLIESSTL